MKWLSSGRFLVVLHSCFCFVLFFGRVSCRVLKSLPWCVQSLLRLRLSTSLLVQSCTAAYDRASSGRRDCAARKRCVYFLGRLLTSGSLFAPSGGFRYQPREEFWPFWTCRRSPGSSLYHDGVPWVFTFTWITLCAVVTLFRPQFLNYFSGRRFAFLI